MKYISATMRRRRRRSGWRRSCMHSSSSGVVSWRFLAGCVVASAMASRPVSVSSPAARRFVDRVEQASHVGALGQAERSASGRGRDAACGCVCLLFDLRQAFGEDVAHVSDVAAPALRQQTRARWRRQRLPASAAGRPARHRRGPGRSDRRRGGWAVVRRSASCVGRRCSSTSLATKATSRLPKRRRRQIASALRAPCSGCPKKRMLAVGFERLGLRLRDVVQQAGQLEQQRAARRRRGRRQVLAQRDTRRAAPAPRPAARAAAASPAMRTACCASKP